MKKNIPWQRDEGPLSRTLEGGLIQGAAVVWNALRPTERLRDILCRCIEGGARRRVGHSNSSRRFIRPGGSIKNKLDTVRYSQFVKDSVQVVPDRVLRDTKRLSDLTIP